MRRNKFEPKNSLWKETSTPMNCSRIAVCQSMAPPGKATPAGRLSGVQHECPLCPLSSPERFQSVSRLRANPSKCRSAITPPQNIDGRRMCMLCNLCPCFCLFLFFLQFFICGLIFLFYRFLKAWPCCFRLGLPFWVGLLHVLRVKLKTTIFPVPVFAIPVFLSPLLDGLNLKKRMSIVSHGLSVPAWRTPSDSDYVEELIDPSFKTLFLLFLNDLVIHVCVCVYYFMCLRIIAANLSCANYSGKYEVLIPMLVPDNQVSFWMDPIDINCIGKKKP